MEQFVTAEAKTGTYVGKMIDGGVQEYLGIRYAKPPQRWKRAELPEPSNKRITALEDNPACYQDVCVEEFPNGEPPMSEDCLYLNIWTSGTEGKKPVYVFIHGGSYVTGSCRTDCFGGVYCGDKFVAQYPDVVYVNIEYRTGPVGSMDLSRFGAGEEYADSPNLQLFDQALAIEWIRQNIEAFGGDPNRITIGGQSAGSYSVYMLMAMPEVRDKIVGVIAESTAPSNEVIRQDMETATAGFDKFFELAGCKTLANALSMYIEDVVRLGPEAKFSPGCGALFGPIPDGEQVPTDIEGIWRSGACSHINVMGGSVSGEFASSVMDNTAEEIAEDIKSTYPDITDDVIAAYCANDPNRDPHDAMEDMLNDLLIRAAHSKAQESIASGGSKVWAYYIDVLPKGAKIRAQHCFELPYVANKLDMNLYLEEKSGQNLLGETPDVHLGEQLRAAWHNFIVNGDPNGEDLEVDWPEYSRDDSTMVITDTWEVQPGVRVEDLKITRQYN